MVQVEILTVVDNVSFLVCFLLNDFNEWFVFWDKDYL
jgi:hypothetical protein